MRHIKYLISFVLIFQFTFVFHIQSALAFETDMGKLQQEQTKKDLKKVACGKNGGSNIGGAIGCAGLDLVLSDTTFLKEVINLVLMMTMALSLINSDCERTKEGKTYKPTSYTANVTHYIHKLASLIYLYAELQTIITLRMLDAKYDKLAKGDGQIPKYQALLKIQKAKLAAAEKKKKILKLSVLGLGASSAIELGMSAALAGWGVKKQISEISDCNASSFALESCAFPAVSVPTEVAAYTGAAQKIAVDCGSQFAAGFTSEALIKEAKSQVTNYVVKGVSAAVGAAIGKGITKKLGGGKGAQIAGAATGGVAGAAVGITVMEGIKSTITQLAMSDEEKKATGIVQHMKEQPVECIQTQLQKNTEWWAKTLALSVAKDSCYASVVGAPACGPLVAAYCAVKADQALKSCRCPMKTAASLPKIFKTFNANLKMTSTMIEKPELLEKLATDPKYDPYLSDLFKPATEWEDTCGADYTGWVVRHDLECKSNFDFLKKDEVADSGDKKEAEVKSSTDASEAEVVASDEEPKVSEEVVSDDGIIQNENNSKSALDSNSKEKIAEEDVAQAQRDGYVVTRHEDGSLSKDYNPSEAAKIREMRIQEYSADRTDSQGNIREIPDDIKEEVAARKAGLTIDNKPVTDATKRSVSPAVSPKSGANLNGIRTKTKINDFGECTKTIYKKDSIEIDRVETCEVKRKPSNIYKADNQFEELLNKEMSKIRGFSQSKAIDINIGLKGSQPGQWAELFFADKKLINDYRDLTGEQKEQTHKALAFLSEALVHLQSMIISSAQAQAADQIVDTKRETSVLAGLGITAVGLLLFPEFIKKGLHMTTVMQRNPLRRGLYYLASYFLAKENVKTNKTKIAGIKKNISNLEKMLDELGVNKEPSTSVFLKIPMRIEGALSLFPAAFANVVEQNQVPLCIEGSRFTTNCTCAANNSCGNNITNVQLRSELFNVPLFAKITGAQLSYNKKMAKGAATENDFDALLNTMEVYTKDIDPEIAADNIDFLLKEQGAPKLEIALRSKNLMASLQKSAIKDFNRLSKDKIDPSQFDFKSVDMTSDADDNFIAPVAAIKALDLPKQLKAKIKKREEVDNTLFTKSSRKEESLDDFDLGEPVIHSNEDASLFKLINNRYRKVYVNGRLSQ